MRALLICVASAVFRSALSSSPQPYSDVTAGRGSRGGGVGGDRYPTRELEATPRTVAWPGSPDGHRKNSPVSPGNTVCFSCCVRGARSPMKGTERRLSCFVLGYFCALFKCPNCSKMCLFVREVDFNDLLRKQS